MNNTTVNEEVMNQGVLILRSYWEAMKKMKPRDRHALLEAICTYGLDGEEPELTQNQQAIFMLIQPVMDRGIRRYQSSVTNGRKGGRPPKAKSSKNPEETQEKPSENQEKDKEKEKDKDIDIDTDKEKEKEIQSSAPAAPAPTLQKKERSKYGWVKLTDEEVRLLIQDLGYEEYGRCVAYIDESAQATGNRNKWKDWNLILRKCSREKWGRERSQVDKYERYSDKRDRYTPSLDFTKQLLDNPIYADMAGCGI